MLNSRRFNALVHYTLVLSLLFHLLNIQKPVKSFAAQCLMCDKPGLVVTVKPCDHSFCIGIVWHSTYIFCINCMVLFNVLATILSIVAVAVTFFFVTGLCQS